MSHLAKNLENLVLKMFFLLLTASSSRDVTSFPQTVRRRIIQYGLQEEASVTVPSDADLDAITGQFVDAHPNSGERDHLLDSYLREQGLRIKHASVRESLLRVAHEEGRHD